MAESGVAQPLAIRRSSSLGKLIEFRWNFFSINSILFANLFFSIWLTNSILKLGSNKIKNKNNNNNNNEHSHADGSLKFWDASAVNLQILYKLKTAKLFEKPRLKSSSSSSTTATNTTTASLLSTSSSSSSSSAQQHQQSSNSYNNSGNLNPSSSSNTNNNNYNTNANNNNTNSGGGGGGGNEMQKNSTNDGQSEFDDLFAIEHLTFSAENRVLCVGGSSSQVIVFRFNKQEAQSEVTVSLLFLSLSRIDRDESNDFVSIIFFPLFVLLYQWNHHFGLDNFDYIQRVDQFFVSFFSDWFKFSKRRAREKYYQFFAYYLHISLVYVWLSISNCFGLIFWPINMYYIDQESLHQHRK